MECKRCGNCCHYGNLWEEGLTEEQKERLLSERKIYKVEQCGMLVFENDIAVCLRKRVLGNIPKTCEEYICGAQKMIIKADKEGKALLTGICNHARKVCPLQEVGVILQAINSIQEIEEKEEEKPDST